MAGGEAGEAFGAEAALLFLGGGDFAGGVLDGLALGFDFLFGLALCQAKLTGVPGGFALFLALADLGVVEGRTGLEFLEQGGAGFFGGIRDARRSRGRSVELDSVQCGCCGAADLGVRVADLEVEVEGGGGKGEMPGRGGLRFCFVCDVLSCEPHEIEHGDTHDSQRQYGP